MFPGSMNIPGGAYLATRHRDRRRSGTGRRHCTGIRADVPEAHAHLSQAGHLAMDEAVDEVANLTRDFLERLPSSS